MDDANNHNRHEAVLASLDKRLALVEQGASMAAANTTAQYHAVERSIQALQAEVRAANTLGLAAVGDLTATPVGRQIAAELAERKKAAELQEARLDDLDQWRDTFKGSLVALRALVIIIGVLASLLSIAATVIALTHAVGHP